MSTAPITIEVEAQAAQAFATAPAKQKRKLELLLSLRLQELTSGPQRPLLELMGEIGARAEQRGLTPEELDALLIDE